MSTTYNATLEVERRDVPDDDSVDMLVEVLREYHPAVGRSARGWLELTITLPATSLAQASTTALAVVNVAVGPGAKAIALEVMSTEEFDARHGMVPIPSLIGTAEAAEILERSQQRVVQLVNAGLLQAVKAGRNFAFARYEVEEFAARERKSGRPPKR